MVRLNTTQNSSQLEQYFFREIRTNHPQESDVKQGLCKGLQIHIYKNTARAI